MGHNILTGVYVLGAGGQGGIWGINVQENLGRNFYIFFTAIQSGHDIKLAELLGSDI